MKGLGSSVYWDITDSLKIICTGEPVWRHWIIFSRHRVQLAALVRLISHQLYTITFQISTVRHTLDVWGFHIGYKLWLVIGFGNTWWEFHFRQKRNLHSLVNIYSSAGTRYSGLDYFLDHHFTFWHNKIITSLFDTIKSSLHFLAQ